jgi:hypothetical protein
VKRILILLMVALAIAGGVSWFASPHPDGLERVAIDHEFEHAAQSPGFELLPDYTVPGLGGFWSNALAGIAGTIAVFGVVVLLGKTMKSRRPQG